MSEHNYKDDPVYKNLRETVYQKKAALQTIYETAVSKVYPPEETLDHIIKLATVSGVYIKKEF